MFMQKISIAAAAAALFSIASTAYASPVPNRDADMCVFDKYGATAVSAYRTEEDLGYVSYTMLRGAQLYVPAKEGLTAEWLAANIQRALSSPQPGPGACQPEVGHVKVAVVPAGPGFWVFLSTSDERSAASLLRWAKSVVPAANSSQPAAKAAQPVAAM